MRLVRSLARLRWAFALKYMLLTSLALLLVEAAVVVGSAFVAWRIQQDTPVVARSFSDDLRTSLALYDNGREITADTAQNWFSGLRSGRLLLLPDGPGRVGYDPRQIQATGGYLGVAGADFSLLGELGRPGAPARAAELSLLTDRLRQGERDPARLHLYRSGHLTLVVPLEDAAGGLRGALLVRYPTAFGDVLRSIDFDLLIPLSLAVIMLGSGLSGGVFGALVARPLVRRLDGVAAMAARWARGDFSQSIVDRSADEIGRLSADLNRMALQVRDLLDAQRQLAALSERQRMARDLHDSVKQQMFAISMNLGTAHELWDSAPAVARQRLEAASALASQGQRELTAIISTLRPAALEDRPLAVALRQELELWSARTGIAAAARIELEAPLAPAAEAALFRIAQEALSNAARHSGAGAVSLALSGRPGAARLEISDDGGGFDPRRPGGGFGLRSMGERAAALGGALEVSSSAAGTRVLAVFPQEAA